MMLFIKDPELVEQTSSKLGKETSSKLGKETSSKLGKESSSKLGKESSSKLGMQTRLGLLLKQPIHGGEKHWFGTAGKKSKGRGHPVMYGKPKPVQHFDDFPDGGGYPLGFMEWAMNEMGCGDPAAILHLCSGSMRTGITVDIRPDVGATIVADCRNTGLPAESFDFIMADPPYARDYAENLYGTGVNYPKPGQILKEAARLLRPNGLVGLLHFIVPVIRRPLKIVRVYGVTTGSGYAIRAWTLLKKI